MGLVLRTLRDDRDYPRPCVMILTCDGDHGLLPAATATFSHDGFIAQRTAAMRAGWKEIVAPAKAWLCPECSGKRHHPQRRC